LPVFSTPSVAGAAGAAAAAAAVARYQEAAAAAPAAAAPAGGARDRYKKKTSSKPKNEEEEEEEDDDDEVEGEEGREGGRGHPHTTATDKAKRQQERLAKNRIWSRLRRQRNRNLTETYEEEIGKMEGHLKVLRQWQQQQQQQEGGGRKKKEVGGVGSRRREGGMLPPSYFPSSTSSLFLEAMGRERVLSLPSPPLPSLATLHTTIQQTCEQEVDKVKQDAQKLIALRAVVMEGREGGREGGLWEELGLSPAQVSELSFVLCERQKEGGGEGIDEEAGSSDKQTKKQQHGNDKSSNDEDEDEDEDEDDFGLAAVETSLARLHMTASAAATTTSSTATATAAASSPSVFPRVNQALTALKEVLEPEQQSRYLEWADANRGAIAGLSLDGGGEGGGGGREGGSGGRGGGGGGGKEGGGKEEGKNVRFHFSSSTDNPFVSKKKFLLPASVSSFLSGGPGASK